ncbi:MAG: hypothetical protein ACI3Y4_07200 [Candidatus Cryptobacteroides sp.]
MRRTLLLFSIFIFLSAAYSNEACAQEARRDSLLFEAAKCEKIVYEAQNPREVNAALRRKAELYKQAGLYKEAGATLERVRMFLVSAPERGDVLVQKALCAFLAEDYDSAISFLAEAGVECKYVQPKLKNEWAAMLLTLLVPAGYCYVGAPGEGAISTVLNLGGVAWAVTQISAGLPVIGILGGCLCLSETYMGAQERVAYLLELHNREALREAKRTAVGEALLECL